ncbi:MAG: cyclic-phosphate processing receiver domain-containing protein [Thermotaleaceae bacterium]
MSKEINLYVDDLRDCPDGFVIARNVDTAIYYLENYNVFVLSLDHDLGEDAEGNLLPTGYDLVKIFCERGYRAQKIYIHTDNGVGRENMYHTLKGAQKRGFIDSDIEIFHYSITENKYTGNHD